MAAVLDWILLCNDGNGLNQFQFKYLNGENIMKKSVCNEKMVNLLRLIRVAWFCTTPVTYVVLVNLCWFSKFETRFWFSCISSIIIYKIVDILLKDHVESTAQKLGVKLPSNYC